MKQPALSLILYTALLLLVPIGFWVAGYHWTAEAAAARASSANQALILLTETGGSKPYAYGFAVAFTLVLAWLVRRRYHPITVIVLCLLSVVGTQAAKSGIKVLLREPRPYVVYLAQRQGIEPQQFYALDKDGRRQMIDNAVRSPAEQPLAEHHKTELGYSFPSGHTSFAAAWLMLFVGFMHGWRRNRRAVWRLAVAAWAAGVLASRVLLGAHFPIDLFAACLLVAVWNIVLFRFVLPPLQRVFRLPETAGHK